MVLDHNQNPKAQSFLLVVSKTWALKTVPSEKNDSGKLHSDLGKYSCLVKCKMRSKRWIFKNEMVLDYQCTAYPWPNMLAKIVWPPEDYSLMNDIISLLNFIFTDLSGY